MNNQKTVLVLPTVEAMMTGVAYFTLSGTILTATYTDGSTEKGRIAKSTASHIRVYRDHLEGKIKPEIPAPNMFALTQMIQSQRALAEQT